MNRSPFECLLLDTLSRDGPMTFEQYMALCLYHPEHGYYMQGHERTGVRGDYFTSADLHPIFARLIARQAIELWEVLGHPERFDWVEMGAGRGWFARDFLLHVKSSRPDFFAALRYLVIESGPKQLAQVAARLAVDDLEARVEFRQDLEEVQPIVGCFFSNELVDAFPVAAVTRQGGCLEELYVTVEGDRLREKPGPLSNSVIAEWAARHAVHLEEGQCMEVNLNALRWLRSVAQKLAVGFVITIDYGDLAQNLYSRDRSDGTRIAYRKHTASVDLLAAPGEQDLTAHVDFSALIDAGKEAGLESTGYTTQERFLMALGEENEFADLYEPNQTETEKLQARLKLKRLIDPGGMGNLFKVLIQHRGARAPNLTGLKFARGEERRTRKA